MQTQSIAYNTGNKFRGGCCPTCNLALFTTPLTFYACSACSTSFKRAGFSQQSYSEHVSFDFLFAEISKEVFSKNINIWVH